MAKNNIFAVDVGMLKSAVLQEDGSLIIMSRKTLSDFVGADWDVVVEIVPSGVKNLKDMLDRAAEQRTEAEAGEQTCPVCLGTGWAMPHDWRGEIRCGACNGTGHV